MATTVDLRVEMILVGERLRPLSEAKIAELAESMAVIGLIHPIVITRPSGVMPELLIGAHRLAAAKRLGWETIPCRELPNPTEDRRRLAEIDENLIRSELSPAERAIHIQARKEIYERMNPESKHGAASGAGRGKKARSSKEPEFGSFSDDTAKKTGRSKSSIKADATRARRIPKIADVVGTPLDKGTELDALAKLPPAEQERLIDEAKAGRPVSARPTPTSAEAIQKPPMLPPVVRSEPNPEGITPEPEASSPAPERASEQYTALLKAWNDAVEPVRRQFVAQYQRDIRHLLPDVG